MKSNRQVWLRIYGKTTSGARAVDRGPPLRIDLEIALSNLERLPRMFVEPDGSFLWTGQDEADGATWKLEGTLYDDGQVIRYVDLRGGCPAAEWHTFLAALGESMATVTLELLDENRIVDGEWLGRATAGEG